MAENGVDVSDFCREIETYLCRKNDGHLIRVVGPSFELVSGWAARGIPLKVACSGIDRYFERYYRNGPRRRPVKIDFCEADVLDVFDEWRRATGVPRHQPDARGPAPDEAARSTSLPLHLQRAVTRLTSARASGIIGPEFDPIIDRASAEWDAARATPGGLRGEARFALLSRLEQLDADMLATAMEAIGAPTVETLAADAHAELASFRERMTADDYARAHRGAVSTLVRARFQLPVLRFS
jgi:hypothetical protein